MEDKYRYDDKINQWVATTKTKIVYCFKWSRRSLFGVVTSLYMTTFFMVICNIGLAASHRQG